MICVICLEDIQIPLSQLQKMKRLSDGLCSNIGKDNIEKLFCKHFFHEKCIKKWFSKSSSCPVCRSHIVFHRRVKLKLYYPYFN